MKTMKKALIYTLTALCLLAALCLTALAAPSRLVDNADLLTESEEISLSQTLDSLSAQYGYDFVVVTVNSLEGKHVQQYADDYYDDNGYADSGILLLICMTTREYAISTAGDCVEIFGESDFDSLENAFLSDLSGGYYYDAFTAFAEKSAYIIKYDKRLPPIWIFVSIGVGILVAFLVIKSMTSKHKSVKAQRGANSYMLRNTFHLDRSRNVFLYSHVSRVRKQQNNPSGGSRSGGGGGGSHGGRSGRF